MAVSRPVIPLARWSTAIVLALLGGAMLMTAWSSYASVREASSTLLRGQANALQQVVRAYVLELDEPLSREHLEALLEREASAGLRFIAAFDRGRESLRAGRPEVALGRARIGSPPEEPVVVGERVRVFFRARIWRGGGGLEDPRHRAPRFWNVVIEFEPTEAAALQRSAGRTFALGAISATTLLLVAGALVAFVFRRERIERQRERERRLSSLGEMSAVLAHEIRNPLASLKGNAQLLAQALPEGDRQRQKADRVVEEALRLEGLTNDLLEYVRGGELARREVNPSELARAAAESIDPDVIEISTASAPPSWRLDPERIRQVLVNLLENAVQAGPPVELSILQRGRTLVFEVKDSGPGVPADERERIFEPFHTRRTRGTGLGLSVAQRLVELHRGTLAVDDHPRGGARFTVSLPQA